MSKIDNFTESFFAEQVKCIEKLSKQKNLIEKMQGQGLKQVQCEFYESGCRVLDLYDFTNG